MSTILIKVADNISQSLEKNQGKCKQSTYRAVDSREDRSSSVQKRNNAVDFEFLPSRNLKILVLHFKFHSSSKVLCQSVAVFNKKTYLHNMTADDYMNQTLF